MKTIMISFSALESNNCKFSLVGGVMKVVKGALVMKVKGLEICRFCPEIQMQKITMILC